jgi:septal ring factor EnvC (AmiA/AmiB activator)
MSAALEHFLNFYVVAVCMIRTREERDQARQLAEGRTAELRRTQVILDGVKNDYAALAATGSDLQAELERRSTQAAHLGRELDIMRDRLASKDAALREARGRASQDFGSAIYIGQGGHRGPKPSTPDLALAETERQLAQMAREKAELMSQMDKMRANNRYPVQTPFLNPFAHL